MDHVFNLRKLASLTLPSGKTFRVHYNDLINAFAGNTKSLDPGELDVVIKATNGHHVEVVNHLKGLKEAQKPKRKK